MLEAGVEVLLLADVTRGIDVGTRADMYSLIRELAANGVAVVMYSSDSSELASLCHRVAVMYDWTVTDILEGDDLTEPNLLRAAVGLGVEAVSTA
jgi:ribose transport system ATP-binding protein